MIVRINDNVALDFHGQPFSDTSKGGMYYYCGATSLKKAQLAHSLWLARQLEWVRTPFNQMDYDEVSRNYTTYLETLEETK